MTVAFGVAGFIAMMLIAAVAAARGFRPALCFLARETKLKVYACGRCWFCIHEAETFVKQQLEYDSYLENLQRIEREYRLLLRAAGKVSFGNPPPSQKP